MNKSKIISVILSLIILCLFVISNNYSILSDDATKVYNVYLDEKLIGVISSEEDLYDLIDEKQQGIKDAYGVDTVYPPNGLEIVETYAYNAKFSSLEDIYDTIEELQDFTIYGYEITISETEDHEEYKIYVLDKEVFTEALKEFIFAFIDEEDYNNYIDGTQLEIEDTGLIYTNMYFEEDITIKETYISTNEVIYDDTDVLAQQLLFGFNYVEESYTVQIGDTIESISEDNQLNTQEFLIANPSYSSKDSLLAVGEIVNITLIDPELSFAYVVYEIKEVEDQYDEDIKYDYTKDSSYSEITTPGVTGLAIITSSYSVVNGEQSQEVTTINTEIIRDTVTQVVTKGKSSGSYGTQIFVDTGTGWAWPTQNYYQITSTFAWRWGKQHNGIDISGTGYGSNIYSAKEGTVVAVNASCPSVGSGYGDSCGSGYGNYVVIYHGNNIYTIYAHLTNNILVSVGQTVSKKQVIGYMGNSGSSTGTHLHFGVSTGNPLSGGSFYNPMSLY